MNRMLTFYSPLIVLTVMAMALSALIFILDRPVCEKIYGFNLAFVGLLVYLYLHPLVLLVATIYLCLIGFRGMAECRFPSENIPIVDKLPIVTGSLSRLINILLMATPLLGICMFWVGNYAFFGLLEGMSVGELQYYMELPCWYQSGGYKMEWEQ